MQLTSNIENFHSDKGTCLTIGNFDGVHLGHQALIESARNTAAKMNLDFALMTFWPHPRSLLGGAAAHMPLTTREERLRLLEASGVNRVIELPFTKKFSSIAAEDFVRTYLLPIRLRCLVVGHDFTLGHNRGGTVPLLTRMGQQYGFNVEQLDVVKSGDIAVSSSLLRKYLQEGSVRAAARLLGHYYCLEGTVGHGFSRGRNLGFPTANLENVSTLKPAPGVYATYAICDGKTCQAVTNIGANPTFDGKKITIESFLLNARADLYDKKMRLEFVDRIRGECKFASPQALVEQIGKDVQTAKKILSEKLP